MTIFIIWYRRVSWHFSPWSFLCVVPIVHFTVLHLGGWLIWLARSSGAASSSRFSFISVTSSVKEKPILCSVPSWGKLSYWWLCAFGPKEGREKVWFDRSPLSLNTEHLRSTLGNQKCINNINLFSKGPCDLHSLKRYW